MSFRPLLRFLLGVLVVCAAGLACSGRAAASYVIYAGDVSISGPDATGRNISFTYAGTSYTDQYAGQLLASFVSQAQAGDFTMFCVDMDHSFTVPASWKVNPNKTGSIYGATVNKAGEIAYLVNNYGSRRLDGDHSAALQAAIWQVEYGNKFTLTTTTTSASVINLYNTYMGHVDASHVATAWWMDPTGQTSNGDYPQGQVSATPAPPSVVMAGAAIACLAGYVALRRLIRPRRLAALAQ